MTRGNDLCLSLRKTYNAVINLVARYAKVAHIITIIPIIYILVFMIVNTTQNIFIYSSYLTGSGFTIFTVLLIAWLISILSVWKIMPNLLTISIFVYKCLAHWALVSFLIILFYISQWVPTQVTGYFIILFILPIISLLFASDVMRAQRSNLYEILNRPIESTSEISSV